MLQTSPMYAYIPVKDLGRARQFYEQKLGLKPTRAGVDGVTYECGGGTAAFMYPTPNAGTSQASQAFWQVDDIEREVAELKSRGVAFEEYDMPGLKTTTSRQGRCQSRMVQGYGRQYHGRDPNTSWRRVRLGATATAYTRGGVHHRAPPVVRAA
jgi:predicted enzyme related to lactoylglutathione lyase